MKKKRYNYIIFALLIFCIGYILKPHIPYKLLTQEYTKENITSYPKLISIPSLNISSPVEFVGQNRKGAMESPQSISAIGWYKYGATPGTIGSSVFAGHVDNAFGLGGIFKDLENIKIGEEIDVENVDGDTYTYIVDEIETTNWMEAPTTKIFGETQKEKLVLITCGGDWDNEWNTYNDRLIVYAKLKENE